MLQMTASQMLLMTVSASGRSPGSAKCLRSGCRAAIDGVDYDYDAGELRAGGNGAGRMGAEGSFQDPEQRRADGLVVCCSRSRRGVTGRSHSVRVVTHVIDPRIAPECRKPDPRCVEAAVARQRLAVHVTPALGSKHTSRCREAISKTKTSF